jgi:hypothetical protein
MKCPHCGTDDSNDIESAKRIFHKANEPPTVGDLLALALVSGTTISIVALATLLMWSLLQLFW